jgi:hypothetical protein
MIANFPIDLNSFDRDGNDRQLASPAVVTTSAFTVSGG